MKPIQISAVGVCNIVCGLLVAAGVDWRGLVLSGVILVAFRAIAGYPVSRKATTVAAFVLFLSLCATASAQPYQGPPPQQPPPSYAYVWQPVAVPGDYIAVPRVVPLFNYWWGPRIYFVPRPQQQQYPGPVAPQGQYQQMPAPQQGSRNMPATLRAVETPKDFVQTGTPQTLEPFALSQQQGQVPQ